MLTCLNESYICTTNWKRNHLVKLSRYKRKSVTPHEVKLRCQKGSGKYKSLHAIEKQWWKVK